MRLTRTHTHTRGKSRKHAQDEDAERDSLIISPAETGTQICLDRQGNVGFFADRLITLTPTTSTDKEIEVENKSPDRLLQH